MSVSYYKDCLFLPWFFNQFAAAVVVEPNLLSPLVKYLQYALTSKFPRISLSKGCLYHFLNVKYLDWSISMIFTLEVNSVLILILRPFWELYLEVARHCS